MAASKLESLEVGVINSAAAEELADGIEENDNLVELCVEECE